MRRGRISGGLTALLAAGALAAATGASAANPMDICKDLADGHLNGHYTKAEQQAYSHALQTDPTMQGYCSPLYVVTPPSHSTTPPKVAHVAGAQKTKPAVSVAPVQNTAPLSATHSSGTLPFTGAQLAVFVVVGLSLLGGGLLLRLTARQKRAKN